MERRTDVSSICRNQSNLLSLCFSRSYFIKFVKFEFEIFPRNILNPSGTKLEVRSYLDLLVIFSSNRSS